MARKIIYLLTIFGAGVGLAIQQANTNVNFLSNTEAEVWFEPGYPVFSQNFSIDGTKILRSKAKPAFIWGINHLDNDGKTKDVPYLIVVKDIDSMQLLNSFSNTPVELGSRLVSVGRVQAKDLALGFSYSIGAEPERDEPQMIESIEFSLEAGRREFDLEKGHVFLVSKDTDSARYKLEQKLWKLPDYDLFSAFERMRVDKVTRYGQFEDWLRKALNRK